MIRTEAARLLRHAITPLVAIAVAEGWIPAAAQDRVVEAAVIVASFAVVYVWSLRNERRR